MCEVSPPMAVVGAGGLVGSAFVELARESQWFTCYPKVSWQSKSGFAQIESWINAELLPRSSRGWSMIWTAGVSGLNASHENLHLSSRFFASTLSFLAESGIDMSSGTLVYMSSLGGIYGQQSDSTMDESVDDLTATPYGKAKLQDERALRIFSETNGVRSISFRLPSLFGPRPKFSLRGGFINSLASHLVVNKPFHIYAPLDSRRPFLYSFDAVGQILSSIDAAQSYPVGTFIPKNIIPDSEFSLRRILREFKRVAGRLPPLTYALTPELTWQTVPTNQITSSTFKEVTVPTRTPLGDSLMRTIQHTTETFSSFGAV